MTTEALSKLHSTRPFQPFFIRLGDGQSLPVEHPEMLAYAAGSRRAVVYLKNGDFEIIDVLLATGLEVISNRRKAHRRR